MTDLNGKITLVTGSSRGIGKAIATALARGGATVIINCKESVEEAQGVVEQLSSDGYEAFFLQADVTKEAEVKSLFRQLINRYGRIDILVNNAGNRRDALTLRMSLQDWDFILDTNLKSAFLCSKEALLYMIRQRWGRIINISSVIWQLGNAGQANYAAAKAGLLGLTRSLAREVGERSITVNAVAPGFVQTELTNNVSPAFRDWVLNTSAIKRLVEPEEVAHLVVFLASDGASAITGQIINVDCGLIMG